MSIDNGVGTVTGSSVSVSPTATTTYTLTAQNASGTLATATVTVTVVAAPAISSFTASAASITAGGSVTLNWTATGATSFSIDSGVGTVTGSSVSVSPTATTTYTLTAKNASGTSVTATATVTVVSASTISSFTTSTSTITSGSSVTLSWAVSNATTVSIDNGIGTMTGTSTTVMPTKTTTYTLTATNAAGSTAIATVTVTVVSAPTISSFTTSASTITSGSSVTLNWAVSNATTVSIDNGIGTMTGTSTTVMPTKTTTYTLTATNAAGSTATATVTVTVASTATIGSFTSSASTITSGSSVTLSWAVSNATTVSIDNGIGTITGTSTTVMPTKTTTYTLTATGSSGSPVAASVTVTVTATSGVTISSFTATPSLLSPVVNGSASATLAWDVSGATTLSIDNGVGTVTGTSTTVTPANTTTYILTATDAAGVATTANVTVHTRTQLVRLIGGGATSSSAWTEEIPCRNPAILASDAAGDLFLLDTWHAGFCKLSIDGTLTDLLASVASSSSQTSAWKSNAQKLDSSHKAINFLTASLSLKANDLVRRNVASSDGNTLTSPSGIAVSSDGKTAYVADGTSRVIFKLTMADGGTASLSTLAGSGSVGSSDGTGVGASFYAPGRLALDTLGNLLVVDGCAVRRIVISTGAVTTLAGNTSNCDTTDGSTDGAGLSAQFDYPNGIAVDSYGNIFVADTFNDLIRLIVTSTASDGTTTATVSTLAGQKHVSGSTDGSGSSALFRAPFGVKLSSDESTLYVADSDNAEVREIALTRASNGSIASGTSSTMAGRAGLYGESDGAGYTSVIVENAPPSAWFSDVSDVALGASSVLYIAESIGHYEIACDNKLRKLNLADNTVSTQLLSTFGDAAGSVDGDAGQALFLDPTRMASDGQGNLYIADSVNNTIRKVALTTGTDGTLTAVVSTLAGTAGVSGHTDGVGAAASFSNPVGLAYDANNNRLYVSDWGNGTIRQINLSTATVSTLAGSAGDYGTRDGTSASDALFNTPQELALDSNGFLYVVEQNSNTIRKIDLSTGIVTTLPIVDGSGSTVSIGGAALAFYHDSTSNKDLLYATNDSYDALLQIDLSTMVATSLVGSKGNSGVTDGTGSAALLNSIWSLATDSAGNVYAVDNTDNLVRRITPAGVVTTIAGTVGGTAVQLGNLPGALPNLWGVIVDANDNLFLTASNILFTLQPE